MTRSRNEVGASAVEYGLLVAGIAALIVTVVFVFGGVIKSSFSDTTGGPAVMHKLVTACASDQHSLYGPGGHQFKLADDAKVDSDVAASRDLTHLQLGELYSLALDDNHLVVKLSSVNTTKVLPLHC